MEAALIAIWDRLVRAQEHFKEVDGMLLAYYNRRLGEVTGEFDPNGKFALEGGGYGIPEIRLFTVAGELLHDLRSALEHLAWELVVANGGNPTENTSWPVLRTRPTRNKKGICPHPNVAGGVSTAARTVLDASQPYQWDDRFAEHPIWVLDKLWNIDKHRHVAVRGLALEGSFIPARTPPFTFKLRTESVSVDGAELVLVPDNPTVDVDIRTTSQVFLYEPKDGVAAPLRRTLQGLCFAVFNVVKDAENSCF